MEEPELADFLTIDQAAAALQIGRTAAYDLARLYNASGGTDGLPVVRVGRQLRVPRAVLERWLGGPLKAPTQPPEGRRAGDVRVVWRSARTRRQERAEFARRVVASDVHDRALA